jgi:hypothetical protein
MRSSMRELEGTRGSGGQTRKGCSETVFANAAGNYSMLILQHRFARRPYGPSLVRRDAITRVTTDLHERECRASNHGRSTCPTIPTDLPSCEEAPSLV